MQETDDGSSEAVDIRITYVSDLSLIQSGMAAISREDKMRENGELADTKDNPVQTRRLYHIADSFIRSVQELAR